MVQALIHQSPDIQKVLAFEGAFEKLFNTVTQEGGVDGGLVAQGALTCVDGLLRFNNSNQVYMAKIIAIAALIKYTELFQRNIFATSSVRFPSIPCRAGCSNYRTSRIRATILG